jgi:hypothetical protein
VRVYVASSWRNSYQPSVVKALRAAMHEVYDFRNPGEGEKGFGWDSIDTAWQSWSVAQFRDALRHPFAEHGFARDKNALDWCQACVLVLPSGMSAHLEAGWCAGQGKPVVIYAPELREAELMYKVFDHEGTTPIFEDLDDVRAALDRAAHKV